MLTIIYKIVFFYNVLVLIYFFALNFFYLFLLLLATGQLYYFKRKCEVCPHEEDKSILTPTIAMLVPAYNEELTIIESIHSFLAVDYSELEVIVVNDGSTDETLRVLKDEFQLVQFPRAEEDKILTKPVKGVYKSMADNRLVVIDKENGGKADSLNAGINYSRSRLFCAIDADSLVEKDALQKLVHVYMDRTAKIVAVGGIVRIANDCLIDKGEIRKVKMPKRFLPAIQVMEYIRAFLCGRAGWSRMNNLLIISGAFGLFKRQSVLEAGGYRTDTVGEDMELVVRLHRMMRDQKKEYKIEFIPNPVCWTEAPDTLRILARQRNRWQRGLIETFLFHKKMMFNPKYGLIGLISMPYFFLFEILGPVIEVTGYFTVIISYILGWLNIKFVILFAFLALLFGVILSLFSLLLEEFTVKKYDRPKDVAKLFLMAVIENFGYRQVHSWWRLKAIFDVMRRKKGWGKMERKPFAEEGG